MPSRRSWTFPSGAVGSLSSFLARPDSRESPSSPISSRLDHTCSCGFAWRDPDRPRREHEGRRLKQATRLPPKPALVRLQGVPIIDVALVDHSELAIESRG